MSTALERLAVYQAAVAMGIEPRHIRVHLSPGDPHGVGAHMREERKAASLSMDAVADHLDVSRPVIAYRETGKRDCWLADFHEWQDAIADLSSG